MLAYLSMGGYWAFVWPALGFAALVLIAMLVASIAMLRRNRSTLARLQAAGGRPRRTRPAGTKHAGVERR